MIYDLTIKTIIVSKINLIILAKIFPKTAKAYEINADTYNIRDN